MIPRGSGAVMDSRPHVSQGKADRDNTSWRCNRQYQTACSCFTLGFMHPEATFQEVLGAAVFFVSPEDFWIEVVFICLFVVCFCFWRNREEEGPGGLQPITVVSCALFRLPGFFPVMGHFRRK